MKSYLWKEDKKQSEKVKPHFMEHRNIICLVIKYYLEKFTKNVVTTLLQ